MRLRLSVLAALVVAHLTAGQQTTFPIVLDGDFKDWAAIPVALRDPADAPIGPDMRAVRLAADAVALFVQVDFERGVNVDKLAGTLALVVDLDADAATGQTTHGLPGADVVVEMSPPGRQGVAIRRFPRIDGRPASEPPSAIGFARAPVYSASGFEARLDRGPSRRAVIKLAYVLRDGTVLDETGAAPIDLPPAAPASPPALSAESARQDPLARRPGTAWRAAAWNVQVQSPILRDRQAAIIDALDPDMLLLNEVRPELTDAELVRWLPKGRPGRAPWRVLTGANEDRTLIAVRGGIERGFDRVPYPPGGLAAFFATGNAVGSAWVTAHLTESGAPASAAVAALGRYRVLASAVHLQCCGSAEDFSEGSRVLQSRAIRNLMRNATREFRPDAVLIGGDFNLVGTRDPLDIAGLGLDVDGSSLAAVYAPQLDSRSTDTWRSRTGGGSFPPGRLDWMLYSSSTLELLGAFAFDSEDVALNWLTTHGLRRDDSIRTSDHLPVVADFRWRK